MLHGVVFFERQRPKWRYPYPEGGKLPERRPPGAIGLVGYCGISVALLPYKPPPTRQGTFRHAFS